MTTLPEAVGRVRQTHVESCKPLAIIVAGHNGSGKSTMWTERLSPDLQMPLVNADRVMMSILPEPRSGQLPEWARHQRRRSWSKS